MQIVSCSKEMLKILKQAVSAATKNKIGFIYVETVYDTQDPDMPELGKQIKFFLPTKK